MCQDNKKGVAWLRHAFGKFVFRRVFCWINLHSGSGYLLLEGGKIKKLQMLSSIWNFLLSFIEIEDWFKGLYYPGALKNEPFLGIFFSKTSQWIKMKFGDFLIHVLRYIKKFYLNLRYEIASWHLVTWTCV